MKKAINSFFLLTGLSLFLLISCTSNDYNTDPTPTTGPTVPDTIQATIPDSAGRVNTDTLDNASATKPNPAVKGKKGKVTSVMMTTSKNTPMNKDKEGYYSSVEILPMFPGGQTALDNFINKNIEYPENANDNGVEGIVTVNFAVDETGKVYNPKVIGKPLGYGLEEEVIKAVNKMPTWTPGIIKGRNVKTYYTLPVNFKLEQ